MEQMVDLSDPVDAYLHAHYHYKGEQTNNGIRYFSFMGTEQAKHVIIYPNSGQDTERGLKSAKSDIKLLFKILSWKEEWVTPSEV